MFPLLKNEVRMTQIPSTIPSQSDFEAASSMAPVDFRNQVPPVRIVLNDSLYYIDKDGSPMSWETHVSHKLRNSEEDQQPYSRKVKLSTEWTPIDPGWLRDSKISVLRITSSQPPPTATQSPEEAEEFAAARIIVGVEIDLGGPIHGGGSQIVQEISSIPVNFSLNLYPSIDLSKYMLKGSRDGLKAIVTLIQE
jgi:hypothetical protein